MNTVIHRLRAWASLWRRYRSAWAQAWARRDQLTQPALQTHEAEFLPAALALQTRPVSPVGRWVARLLIGLVIVALSWSFFGQVDIIVNAQGKIIPSQRTKTIASIEVASVRALYVSEGQSVHAGDLLVELDARASDSEHDKAAGDHQNAQLQAARARALISALTIGTAPRLAAFPEVPAERWQDAQQHLLDQWRDYTAKSRRLDDEIRRYAQALPLAVQRAEDYRVLARDHDVSHHAWTEKEQARIDLQGQLNDARNQKAALTAELRKNAQDALSEAQRVLAETAQDARRAAVHSELLKLVAPVDGTVQQLTVHTVGGVVPAAQPLMQIVPRQGVVEVEAFLENKDVGFVQEGQAAQVKIDAFAYTKYGTVPAAVSHVSRDAIQDDKRGWLYSVKIALNRLSLPVDGREAPLTPGMTTSVEIKTGTRRVIEYVLSPLVEHGRESLRER
ncbi:HlyD family type I secretion periplasmic adaptor subunit [Variovorax terrae]|uniref:Membrane fusion protein (MFP) family protein n=1 Tax=Variovorax terrae TaxID=2923278 RepID=A0A9X2ALU6_9BURK|nr:HlyD family type I secretion periplasmic adaptor subunit [Variovorax terrae]MCJ0762035.1 HlyD family type I secretion periplasmic adaptor subunit [Variovorax terrae]